jgi:hypothetical protein
MEEDTIQGTEEETQEELEASSEDGELEVAKDKGEEVAE